MSDRRRLWRDIALLLLILLPYFIVMLSARPLNVPDEGRYPEIAREMLVSGDFITPRVNGAVFLDKPALYYWLEAASMKALGVNLTAIRLAPALFGVVGCLLVFLTGYRFFNRRTAWLATGALATFPLYFLSSQYANLDLEVAVWITAALVGFLFAQAEPLDSPRRRWYFILAYTAGGFGVLTKGLIGIVLPAIAIFTWMLWERRWRELPRWGLVWLPVGVLAVCLPWYSAVQMHNPQFLHFFFIYQQFQRFTGGGFNNVFPAWFYPAVLMLGLLPWSIWLPCALRDGWQAQREDQGVRSFLMAWPLAILVFFSLPASKIVSYILPTVPPLALLMGAAFDRWLSRNRQAPILMTLTAVVPLAIAVGLLVFAARVPHIAKYTAHPVLPMLLRGLAVSLLIAVAVLVAKRRDGAQAAAWSLGMAGAAIALWLGPLVPCFDKESMRDTADALRPMLTADAVVVTYHNYYQDLPVYLNRPDHIRVVDNWTDPNIVNVDNWRREFFFALRDQPEAHGWLLDDAAYGELLRGSRPVFTVTSNDEAVKVASRFGQRVVWHSPHYSILVKGG
ncbi:MAG: phospholipid carrier-dependent glycosyltransferase [Burkholderiales bacterium]|nr:phospholipid carrier-dependent glycosyltransferase [Burkholderiales bacterium]